MPADIKKKSRGSGKHGLHDAMARLADRMGNHPAYRRRNGRRENGSHSGDRRAQTGLQGQRHGDDALGRLVQREFTGSILDILALRFDPGALFADGFISGNTTAWSAVVP